VPSFESYDLAHLEFILRAASRIRRAHPALAPSATTVGVSWGRRGESAPGAMP
jgi:hypothetical protein